MQICIAFELKPMPGWHNMSQKQLEWRRMMRFLIGVVVALAASQPAFCLGQSPDDVMREYYATVGSAKSLSEIEPFLSDKIPDSMRKAPEPLAEKLALMMLKQEPTRVKVLNKKEEDNRVTYTLAPESLTQEQQARATKGDFSMRGELVLVKEGDSWKVHKDFWTISEKQGGGTLRTRFGLNPDRAEESVEAQPPADREPPPGDYPSAWKDTGALAGVGAAADYPSKVRNKLMSSWKPAGSGKDIYATVRMAADGSVSQIRVKGKKPQKVAEDQIRGLIVQCSPFDSPPSSAAGKPLAWLMFHWTNGGARSISGPYLETKLPDWIEYIVGFKKKPYEKVLFDRIMQRLESATGQGSAR